MTTQNEIKPVAPAEGLDGGRCAVDAGFGPPRPVHRWPLVSWWRGPDEGKQYSSIVALIFPGSTWTIGLWALWAHDWKWTNIKRSDHFRVIHLGPVLLKIKRGSWPNTDYPAAPRSAPST